ncbi:MAG: ABC transporter permease, partial [bacterium]|nr:ABC transporter permease [bacterium]
MKSNIITIIRKEFQRFFGDRRMLLTTVLLPGLMIYVIYSLMGSFMADRFTVGEEERPLVLVQSLPESMEPLFAQLPLTMETADDAAQAMDAVSSDVAAAYVEFPEAFDGSVAAYDV